MKRRDALGILLAGSALQSTWAIGKPVKAEKIDNKELLKNLRLTNAYFVKKWPDTGKSIITNRERPSNIWTRGVYYEGLMALYQVDKQKSYYDYAVSWGENHKWGLRNGIQTRNGDDQCCGQTYIDLYLIDKKEERIKDIKASMDLMLASDKKDDWWWIDALQMAMPVLAQLGVIYKDNRYFTKMYEMYNYTKTVHGSSGLFNAQEGLWWRDKDFVPPYKTPAGKNCYWSRGNGWVVAALVRVLDIMPKNAPHREEYEKMLLTMLTALVPLQRKDGYWNVSLTDASDFGGKEVTGTSLFLYGMAWAVNTGLVKRKDYEPVITKAWNAMTAECVHENGFLGFVQGTGKEPKDGQPVTYNSMPDFEDFGLGCFLLAGSEIYKMK
ncbi:glycoside hydrolase family 88/105 protein [Dyadobacter psychrotolerans]|uniref:Glycoside hydrolase family 88 protein n=1 Tax=Dyadobacter psychrotolerans TaxID=2541721 RepID=A0A4R5DVR2_9BACT|nr:glycoside hydrolase family 88 protein [Dyadobacter psychrotolerans]TDE16654.1 glycoside hydrolase family 88 protein [Dyadobacter psychrotolerans]